MDKMDIWVYVREGIRLEFLCKPFLTVDQGLINVKSQLINLLGSREVSLECCMTEALSWLVHSKMCFFIFPKDYETSRRVSCLGCFGCCFSFKITISKNFEFRGVGGRWGWGERIIHKRTIHSAHINKKLCSDCTIFQLFEITFLLLFVFLRVFVFRFYVCFQNFLKIR